MPAPLSFSFFFSFLFFYRWSLIWACVICWTLAVAKRAKLL